MTCWQTFHHRSITCTSLYNIFIVGTLEWRFYFSRYCWFQKDSCSKIKNGWIQGATTTYDRKAIAETYFDINCFSLTVGNDCSTMQSYRRRYASTVEDVTRNLHFMSVLNSSITAANGNVPKDKYCVLFQMYSARCYRFAELYAKRGFPAQCMEKLLLL